MNHGVFKPSNPWPDPEPDSEQRGRVWREWALVVGEDIDVAAISDCSIDPDVRVVAQSVRQLTVRIRSDDPKTCDVHELMKKVREVFEQIDARWQLVTIQGVPKEAWLFMR